MPALLAARGRGVAALLLAARSVPSCVPGRLPAAARLSSSEASRKETGVSSSRVSSPRSAPIPADGKTLRDFLPGGGSGSARRPVRERLPPWLKMTNPNRTPETAARYALVRATVADSGFATVCQEARCPNIGECWSTGTATVMILGDTCTRGCRFCSVKTSRTPPPPDAEEPRQVAEAVREWAVDYIVITMVDRDDLADGGAGHVVETVRRMKSDNEGLRVEALVGDFQGNLELVGTVASSGVEVFAHNLETVERLQRLVRDRRAGYQQSLAVLRHAKVARPDVVTKSSIMVGFGETKEELLQAMRDLREAGVDIVTFGQYLQPTRRHMKVARYIPPEEFQSLQEEAEALGFHVASGAMVRSSYKAGALYEKLREGARQHERASSEHAFSSAKRAQ